MGCVQGIPHVLKVCTIRRPIRLVNLVLRIVLPEVVNKSVILALQASRRKLSVIMASPLRSALKYVEMGRDSSWTAMMETTEIKMAAIKTVK